MRVRVRFIRENRVVDVELPENSCVRDLLSKLNLRSISYIVLRNGTPLPESSEVRDGDELEILPVASGGIDPLNLKEI